MGTVKLANGYYQDKKFNRWSVDKYTEEQAIAASESLENCTLCIDCENCKDCKICIDCDYCFGCRGCVDCVRCENCVECWYCADCEDCMYCNNCKGCIDCAYCDDCRNCGECISLYNWSYQTKVISSEEEKKERMETTHCVECGKAMSKKTAEKNIERYGVPCCSKACEEKYTNFEKAEQIEDKRIARWYEGR